MDNQSSRDSVYFRWKLISDGCAGSIHTPEALINACKTQSSLAALSLPNSKIHPISLNTMKTVAENTLTGGWKSLDANRRKLFNLKKLIADTSKKKLLSKREKAGNRLETLNQELDGLRRGYAVLLRGYEQLLDYMHQSAGENPGILEYLERHEETWDIRRLHVINGDKNESE